MPMPRARRTGPRAWLALGTALLFLSPAVAVAFTQGVATTLVAKGAEDTLLEGDAGATVLGASGASATTSLAALSASPQAVLRIHALGGSWSVRILCSAVGFGASDAVTVRLEGTSASDQCTLTNGVLTQASGLPLSHAVGADLAITVAGSLAPGGSGTLAMAVLIVPAGDGSISLAYPYSLQLAS